MMKSLKNAVQKGPLKELVDMLRSEEHLEGIHKIISDLEKEGTPVKISVDINISTPSKGLNKYRIVYGSFEKRPLTVKLKENIPEEYRDELSSLARSYKNLDELKKEIKKINRARDGWRTTLEVYGKSKIVRTVWQGNLGYDRTPLATIEYAPLEDCLKDENVL